MQQNQAPSILKDCQPNHEGASQYEVQTISKSFQSRDFKNFGGGSVGCLKITEDKGSDVGLKLTRGLRFNSKREFHNRCEGRVL